MLIKVRRLQAVLRTAKVICTGQAFVEIAVNTCVVVLD